MNASLLILALFIVVTLIQLAFKKEHAMPYLFAYNIIFDVLGYLNDGNNNYAGLYRAVYTFTLIGIVYIKYKPRFSFFNVPVFLFVIYTSLLVFNSSNFGETVRVHLRVSTYFLFADALYVYYKNSNVSMQVILSKFIWVHVVYILYTIAANIFDLGNLYRDRDAFDALQTGDIVGDFLLQISFAVLLIPLIFHYIKSNWFRIAYLILSSISITFLLASARRTSVLIILVGFIVFLFFYREKTKAFLISLAFLMFASVFILQFADDIMMRYNSRFKSIDVEQLEGEGRTKEYPIVTELIFSFDDPLHSMIGKDLYANKGVVPGFSVRRTLHTDYARLLHGAGIIGFILYIMLIMTYFFKALKNFKVKLDFDQYKIHISIAIMLIACKAVLSYTGGFHVISFNALIFGMLNVIFAKMDIKRGQLKRIINGN